MQVQPEANPSGFAERMDRYLRQPFLNGIWIQSAWGRNRWLSARKYFGDQRVERIAGMLPTDGCLLIVYNDPASVFPFLLHFRRAAAFSAASLASDGGLFQKGAQAEYVLFADGQPPAGIDMKNWRVLWRADASVSKKAGLLLQTM